MHSIGVLSSRRAMNFGWRIDPSGVHSENAHSITCFGATQCASRVFGTRSACGSFTTSGSSRFTHSRLS